MSAVCPLLPPLFLAGATAPSLLLGVLPQGSVAYRPGAPLGGGALTPAERASGVTADGLPVGGGPVAGWATEPAVAKHKHADIWSTG